MLKLTPELVSLIHHTELNNSEWWESSVQNLILYAIWLSGEPLNDSSINSFLLKNIHVDLEIEKLSKEIEKLISAGAIVKLHNDKYKITEPQLKKLETNLADGEKNELKSKQLFLKIIKETCPSLDSGTVWNQFNNDFLFPLIQKIGANTYKLISKESSTLDPNHLEDFINRFPQDIRSSLHTAIGLFLDVNNPIVRTFVLSRLNTYFFIEATNLDKQTINNLTKQSGTKVEFNAFIDTNFLLSILGLHENTVNTTAIALSGIVKKIMGEVKIKLYLLPITLSETKKVLKATQNMFHDIRMTPHLAQVSLDQYIVGDIGKKFLEAATKSKSTLEANSFYSPYITDLTTIIRSKGLELYNETTDEYEVDNSVNKDIENQLLYEKKRYGDHAKDHEQLLHDIVLWYFCRDKRPQGLESPLQAKYWIITEDYRCLGFDAFKLNVNHTEMPICIHPTTFMQMLQFWVPRTEEFEKAMFSTLKAPYILGPIDRKTEEISIRILRALGRFENIDDLPKEIIATILLNSALRKKMKNESEIEGQIELIKDQLIIELSKKNIEVSDLKKKVETKKQTLTTLKRKEKNIKTKLQKIEHNLKEETRKNTFLSKEFHSIKEELNSRKNKELEQNQIKTFILNSIIKSFVAIFILAFSISWLLNMFISINKLIILGLATIIWLFLIDRDGSQNIIIKKHKLFIKFHKFKILIIGLVGIILTFVLNVASSAVWDLIKYFWHIKF